MRNPDMQSPDYLMARAARCRALASQAYSPSIAQELEKLASDYDSEALICLSAVKAVSNSAAGFAARSALSEF